MMKVNRFHRLFLEELRRQCLQYKDDPNVRQRRSFPYRRSRSPGHSSNPAPVQPVSETGGSGFSGLCGPAPAGLQPDRIPARRAYPHLGKKKKGTYARLLQIPGRRSKASGSGRESDSAEPSAALPQKKQSMVTDAEDRRRHTDGRRCNRKTSPGTPKGSDPAFHTRPGRDRRLNKCGTPRTLYRNRTLFYFTLPTG
jgi:hypothetical protein